MKKIKDINTSNFAETMFCGKEKQAEKFICKNCKNSAKLLHSFKFYAISFSSS